RLPRGGQRTAAGVSASSAENVWVVGREEWSSPPGTCARFLRGPPGRRRLAADTASALRRGFYVELDGVAAISSTDVWAVGYMRGGRYWSRSVPVAVHWTGRAWSGWRCRGFAAG